MKGQNLRSASIHQRIRVVGCADATRWSRAEVLHCEGTTPAAHHLNTAIIDIEDVGKNRCNRPPAPQARANSVISRRGLCVKMVFNAARTIGRWYSRFAASRSVDSTSPPTINPLTSESSHRAEGAIAGGPYCSARSSAGPSWRVKLSAQLIRPTWLKACGKLPSMWLATGSNFSASKPTSLHRDNNCSNSGMDFIGDRAPPASLLA